MQVDYRFIEKQSRRVTFLLDFNLLTTFIEAVNKRSYYKSCSISSMNGVDVTRNIKKSQKQGSSTQRGNLETIQSSYHSDMRATNLSKDLVPRVSLPFPSEKNDVKIIDKITFHPHGEFTPVDATWRKSKCKLLQLHFSPNNLWKSIFREESRPSSASTIKRTENFSIWEQSF